MQVGFKNEAKIKDKLTSLNPLFSPDKLAAFFPEYRNFERNLDLFGVWQNSNIRQKIARSKHQHAQVLLLLSGVAGGGKDAMREKIEELYPGSVFKIITATSRKPREDEQDGRDYYFYDSIKQMQQEIDESQFLEHIYQGERLYGLPKKSLAAALERPEPILCTHMEMTAWPKVAQLISERTQDPPFVLRVFVIPQINYHQYANQWLPQLREDYQARMSRTLWELATAPKKADILMSNFYTHDPRVSFLEWQTQSLLRVIIEVLQPAVIKKFFNK